MPKSLISDGSSYDIDNDWYLNSYPDVASSGISAAVHYANYGRFEGRFPRLLLSKSLEEKLWSGYSNLARAQLESLFFSEDTDINERYYSAWSLARWHASNQQWETSEQFASFLVTSSSFAMPGYIRHQGLALLLADIYVKLRKYSVVEKVLEFEKSSERGSADLLLAKANAAAIKPGAEDEEIESQKLLLINAIYVAAQICTIKKQKSELPLTLDNLIGLGAVEVVSPKRISVIMPAYNAQNHIASALRGILNQTWSNIEVIVVDDCSIDRTASIVERFCSQDDRVRLIRHETNRGAYAARNTALKFVTGDFITTHDSDDWSHPQRLELQVTPLICDSKVQVTIANWVRTEPHLHFMKWRPDANLVHTSVSTLLFRANPVISSGGWDEVKVAGDSELFQRIKAVFGKRSIVEVLNTVPLVLARHVPESLTNTAATHARTEFFGLRRTYQEMYQAWHTSIEGSSSLPPVRKKTSRCFPAPVANLYNNNSSRSYTIVLLGNFSSKAQHFYNYQKLIEGLSDQGITFAIFHWPDFKMEGSTPIDIFFLNRALDDALDILTADQSVHTSSLLLLDRFLFKFHPDTLPQINFVTHKVVSNLLDFDDVITDAVKRQSDMDYLTIKNSNLFNTEWYLSQYPDVRIANIDAVSHYLSHGALEGREPSPDFNTGEYFKEHPPAAKSFKPALLNYLNAGKKQGYKASHPLLPGCLPYRSKAKTILLCGHASDRQLFGAERSLIDTLDALALLQLNVVVTVPSAKNPDYIYALQQRSLEVIIVPSPLWVQSVTTCDWAINRFSEIIRSHSIDLVYVNTIMQREPLIAAKSLAVKSIVHVHEILHHDDAFCDAINLPPDTVYLQVSMSTDYAIANSSFTSSNLKYFRKVYRVGNTVDFEKFDIKNEFRGNEIKIALISSNLPKKGIYDFITLARAMEHKSPTAKLLLIGPQNLYIEQLQKNSPVLPSNLSFLDYDDNPLMAIANANIVINISHCQETFGRTLLEAMAARRAVVAYDWGALGELIQDGKNGFLVPFRSLDCLEEKLHTLCASPEQILEMGENGRALALKLYAKNITVEQFSQIYKELLAHN